MRRALGSHGSAPAAAAPVQPAQMLRSHVMACSSISSRSSRSSSASGGVISRSWGLRTNPGEAAGLHTGTTSSSLLHSHASLPLHQLKSAAHGWPQSSYAMQHAQRGQVACSAAGAGRSYARARPQPEVRRLGQRVLISRQPPLMSLWGMHQRGSLCLQTRDQQACLHFRTLELV